MEMQTEAPPCGGVDLVRPGSRVAVRDEEGEDEFVIVHPEDADAPAGRISLDSPLGRALIGRSVNAVQLRQGGGRSGSNGYHNQ
jgi:transcription elongation GreA/GreB family factor